MKKKRPARDLSLIERDTKIIADYTAGVSLNQLAKKYGMVKAAVYSMLKRRGVPAKTPRIVHPKALRELALELRRQGMSVRDTAAMVGVGRHSVCNWARAVGQTERRGDWMADELRKLRRLHAQGLKLADIAKKMEGRSKMAVHKKLRTLGLSSPRWPSQKSVSPEPLLTEHLSGQSRDR